MNATLKRYQAEHRHRLDSLEKSQAELKKIRRKSQGGRNPFKYECKEIEYVETITSRQNEIQKFIADGCKEALLEEKRRFCFLVDKHCSFSSQIHHYHMQSAELINSKLPRWQETCSDVTKVPEKIMNMIEEIKTPISTPMSGTPLPSPMIERSSMVGQDCDSLSKYPPKIPAAPSARALTSPLIDLFKNPATVAQNSERKNNLTGSSVDPNLPRSVSMASGLNMVKKQKVKTIFPHTAGANQTLLSFAQGDVITLLISEEKDGWMYGSTTAPNEGLVPVVLHEAAGGERGGGRERAGAKLGACPQREHHELGGKEQCRDPPPDYLEFLSTGAAAAEREDISQKASNHKAPVPKPESTPPNNANGFAKPPFLSGENPFATVKLRPTVTNDRSAPIIR